MSADARPEPMKRWLWYFADEHGPWFGVVLADSLQAADRLVRSRLADECDDIPAVIHLQECDEGFSMAKGYL